MLPSVTIQAFDQHLSALGLRFDGVVIGGSALALMGVIQRETQDFDIMVPDLPAEVAAAALTFAVQQRSIGVHLKNEWLNNGPRSLADLLPDGWRGRVMRIYTGSAIVLDTLGRMDLLRSKLFALCDRSTDLADCLALTPSAQELSEISPWVEYQDTNPDWPAHVRATLADLARRLGHV